MKIIALTGAYMDIDPCESGHVLPAAYDAPDIQHEVVVKAFEIWESIYANPLGMTLERKKYADEIRVMYLGGEPHG
jgi:hypothetical protein